MTAIKINKAALDDLRQRDYTHYLALWLVLPDQRGLALALFDLEAELLAIPTKVTEPTLGLMRIVWWRDAVLALATGEAKAHPLLQALQPCLASHGHLVADWIESFDLPFLPEDEQNERLQARQALEGRLFGPASSGFLQKARKSPNSWPIIKVLQAVRAGFKAGA